MIRKQLSIPLALTLSLALAACNRTEGGSTAPAPAPAAQSGVQAISSVPLGDVAGGQKTPPAATMKNPYEGNAQAVQEGHQLFIKMNCAGCHGYDAKGAMGPNLTDSYWRYGGAPVQIFKSIYEGRPQGMPAWNPALPPDDIWKLVAYVQSLGGSFPADAYQAGVQGDRAQTNVAPEAPRTLPPDAKKPKDQGEKGATQPEARPDAGGHP